MRASWSKRNDENAERYRERTVGRLRALTTNEVKDESSQVDLIRARVERIKAEFGNKREPGAQGV